MSFANLGFESGADGLATAWALDNFTAAGIFADLGPGGAESFEDWDPGYAFAVDPLAPAALFSVNVYVTPHDEEDFENGWDNTPYLWSTFQAAAAAFAGPESVDDFTGGWSNDAYLTAFAGGELTAAAFDGNAFENFEQSWGNTGYLTEFAGPELAAPSLSGVLAKTVEDFEDVKGPQLYTGDTINDSIVSVAHGLGVGYGLIFSIPVAGAMPAPLAPGVRYWVTFVIDPDNFNLTPIGPGGASVDITSAGLGLLQWTAPWEFWTKTLANF